MDNYIIYEVRYKKEVIYIGSGLPGRETHAISGSSHNAELNYLFITDPTNLEVVILRENLSKEDSLETEKEFIQATEPRCNKTHTNRNRKIKKQLINL